MPYRVKADWAGTMRFNPPPNWPTPPPGWSPPPGWQPDSAWGPPPPDWPLWVPDTRRRRTLLIVGGGIVAVIAVWALVLTLYFTRWSKESDEQQIRSLVARMDAA